MTPISRRLILVSTSPRRRELMAHLKLPFECQAPKFEERSDPALLPVEEAMEFARAKAASLVAEFPNALLIGSDTLIAFEGEKIGKPRDSEDALRILEKLSGKIHQIFTAVAVLDASSGKWSCALSQVTVAMRASNDAERRAYVATGEPLDKAGAYAIQGEGRHLIRAVEGDYFAAVGLPLHELAEALRDFGLEPSISFPLPAFPGT